MKSYRNHRILVVLGLPQFLGAPQRGSTACPTRLWQTLAAGLWPGDSPPWKAERAERARLALGTTKEVLGFIDVLDFKDFLGFSYYCIRLS